MTRRQLFLLALAARLRAQDLEGSPARVVASDASQLKVERLWSGEFCRSKLVNRGRQAARVNEVVLFSLNLELSPDTKLYGESFQMLSQTAGTLRAPVDLGYSEKQHYKIPQPDGATVLTGMMTLTPPESDPILMAFTSCKRFIGRFYLRAGQIDVALDTEGLEIGPGESWDLEEFTYTRAPSRNDLLANLASRIERHHPPLRVPTAPTGWCSWYCFGPRVTAQQVLDNLETIRKDIPALKYVQIDDGYQPAMGDWLETGQAFGGNVQGVLQEIRKKGFEPAIWVAPFVAEEGSHVFQQHPDWFIKNAQGKPLPSNEVTFGGWRRGPWYALDGTNPEAQKHLTAVFRTMRRDWGCTYFKLDANFWGAMHGGRLHDPKATRIEAYRRGMEAIHEGAGSQAGESFILGCNHPIWPSFGEIHGSRSSADIKRTWETISKIARQNLNRNWQNRRLWWNDPDAVVLDGTLPENEFVFHATSIYASGGMVLSGDDLTKMPPRRMAMLRKLLPPTGVAAEFADESLRLGIVSLDDKQMYCVFNWGEASLTFSFPLAAPSTVSDYWSGENLGRFEGRFTVRDLPPHSARLLAVKGA